MLIAAQLLFGCQTTPSQPVLPTVTSRVTVEPADQPVDPALRDLLDFLEDPGTSEALRSHLVFLDCEPVRQLGTRAYTESLVRMLSAEAPVLWQKHDLPREQEPVFRMGSESDAASAYHFPMLLDAMAIRGERPNVRPCIERAALGAALADAFDAHLER
jgi:hypothetical protein